MYIDKLDWSVPMYSRVVGSLRCCSAYCSAPDCLSVDRVQYSCSYPDSNAYSSSSICRCTARII